MLQLLVFCNFDVICKIKDVKRFNLLPEIIEEYNEFIFIGEKQNLFDSKTSFPLLLMGLT